MQPSDKGAGALEYAASIALASVVFAALFGLIGDRPVQACKAALCQIFGGDDCGQRSAAHARPPYTVQNLRADQPGGPVKPPIPKPVCSPDPNAPWVDRLNAHNDYENKHPVKSALSNGATSVEADVAFDENGKLVVSHRKDGSSDSGPFRKMYVQRLIDEAKKNGGAVYPGRGQKFQLFVEIKGGGQRAYDQVLKEIEGLPPDVEVVLPVSATDPAHVINAPPNVSFYQSFDDGCTIPHELLYPATPEERQYAQRVSVLNGDFKKCVSRDNWALSKEEEAKYAELLQRAHDAGFKVRMWGGPDGEQRLGYMGHGHFRRCTPGEDRCANANRQAWWRAQLRNGADYIVTNHLGTGADWLTNCGPPPKTPKPPWSPPGAGEESGSAPPPTYRPPTNGPPSPSPAPSPRNR
ncbi:hypothetical protein [Actinomadura chokoriensis]|uniref:Uncharacterized protein n=1 Tax=Actinomadura chokoriensis TaxID=454156 RepID=A0ABV4R8B0_9ACTN